MDAMILTVLYNNTPGRQQFEPWQAKDEKADLLCSFVGSKDDEPRQ